MLVNESLLVEAVIGLNSSFGTGSGDPAVDIVNGSSTSSFPDPPAVDDKFLESASAAFALLLLWEAASSAAALSISAMGGSGGRDFRGPYFGFGGAGKLFSICAMSIVDCSDSGLVTMTLGTFPQVAPTSTNSQSTQCSNYDTSWTNLVYNEHTRMRYIGVTTQANNLVDEYELNGRAKGNQATKVNFEEAKSVLAVCKDRLSENTYKEK